MITASELVSLFRVMWAGDWEYVWGGASKGKVDCSGAIVYAYKQYGQKIYHGSNRMARVHVERLIPIDEALRDGLVVPGMAAFRSHEPGSSKHSISAQYKEGGSYYNGDLRDYYHVGIVDTDTEWVLNAAGTSNDFERHPLRENWSHVAKLLEVDYDAPFEEETDMIDDHETIRKGAKGPAVVSMQGLLRRRGYDIEADGKFGNATRDALKAFQASVGLAADGICGPLTWAALREGLVDEEMVPEEPAEKTWEQMTLAEKVEDLHRWRLSMMEGGGTDGS